MMKKYLCPRCKGRMFGLPSKEDKGVIEFTCLNCGHMVEVGKAISPYPDVIEVPIKES